MKEIRKLKGLTQTQASQLVGINLRTYQNYESGKSTRDSFKKDAIMKILVDYKPYSETKGIYTKEKIIEISIPIFKKYGINYAYLFGSYAKDKARDRSDIDFMVSDEAKGLNFVGLQNDLMEAFNKKVDILRIGDLKNNDVFLNEILKSGEKIYENNN